MPIGNVHSSAHVVPSYFALFLRVATNPFPDFAGLGTSNILGTFSILSLTMHSGP